MPRFQDVTPTDNLPPTQAAGAAARIGVGTPSGMSWGALQREGWTPGVTAGFERANAVPVASTALKFE